MPNLFVKNLPSIKEREFKYRGKISSEDLNDVQQEAFNDILDLFNKANQLQKAVYEMKLSTMIESECYAVRLEEAIAKQRELEERYHNLTDAKDYRTITKYPYEAKTDIDDYAAVIDSNTNDITAHIVSSKSKTRVYDETYDEMLVPDSLQAYIGPDSFEQSGDVYIIEDSEIKNAFDGNKGTAWFRRVVTATTVAYVDNEIVIGLPEDIITTRFVNQLTISTFPAGYLDILDIQFKSNGAWTSIPGFKKHNGCTEKTDTDIFGNTFSYWSIENASDLKFNFQNIQTNQIKIKMRQRHFKYDEENNRREWYLGLRNVDVTYNLYTNDHSEFTLTYDFPETDKNIKIYDAPVIFNNENNTDDTNFGVSKEFYYYDSDGHSHKIATSLPFILEGHKMMVKYIIEGNQTTPNIHACSVKYKLS